MARSTFSRVSVSAAVAAAVASALAPTAGCYLAAPSCEDKAMTRKLTIPDDDYQPLEDGALRIRDAVYPSCREACMADRSTLEVRSCKPPSLVIGAGDGGARTYALTCEVLTVDCDLPTIMSFSSGRRPEGLAHARAEEVDEATSVGAWLSEVARLEAASVPAFERLARELAAHGAPARLVRAARRSMNDEVRHARVTRALARRHGGSPVIPSVGALPVRSLEAVATENAVEGCVNETLGAMIATYQAARATDPPLRRAFAIIAKDETRHAELSWEVLSWSLARLEQPARARALAAMDGAVRALDARLVSGATRALRDAAGLPDATSAARMLAEARRLLWARAARSAA